LTTLHLDGEAHEWWYHGLVTFGHAGVTSYLEFRQRLIKRFERKDLEIHFIELAQLKQTGSPEAYISEFQRVDVMVSDISKGRLLMLFVEGLMDLLRGWVKASPNWMNKPTFTLNTKEIGPPQRDWVGKPKLDELTMRELRKKKLCFSYQEPWAPRHRCTRKDRVGKAYYIEVYSDSDSNEDEVVEQAQDQGHPTSGEESSQDGDKDPIMASMSGFQRYYTFRVRGVLQGHKVTLLIDGGASHKFIEGNMVER
jgi:hypothetical protein